MMHSIAKVLVLASVGAACSATPAASQTPGAAATPSAVPSSIAEPSPSSLSWADDLARFDQLVRTVHVAPFVIHSETEWSARLAEVGAAIDMATPDEQIALVSSLVGLLDTHSAFVDIPGG